MSPGQWAPISPGIRRALIAATVGAACSVHRDRTGRQKLIQHGGLLGEVYRCIKRQYPAMAVRQSERAGTAEAVVMRG